jgi:hypothetical protein
MKPPVTHVTGGSFAETGTEKGQTALNRVVVEVIL